MKTPLHAAYHALAIEGCIRQTGYAVKAAGCMRGCIKLTWGCSKTTTALMPSSQQCTACTARQAGQLLKSLASNGN